MRARIPIEYERLCEGNSQVFVRSDRRPMLQHHGLTRFGDFLSTDRGEVVNSHSRREVVRMDLDDGTVRRTVFLKRFRPSPLKDALKDLLRLRRVRTPAMAEFEGLCAFREVALAVPEAIACGERHVLGRDRASFIMVEGLASGRPLDEVLAVLADPGRRRRLITAVAAFVRRMHETGCTHPDLFARHLFVGETGGGTWSVSVIDLQRARRAASLSGWRRGGDIAALMVSLPPGVTTVRERLEFLHVYLDKGRLDRKDVRFVRRAVLSRARRLSRRTVYRSWRPILENP